jgi:adenine phosphoribosyltransferase
MDLNKFIRGIPDFPKKGILFYDITPLLADAAALDEAIGLMVKPFVGKGIMKVAAIESRGFIFGSAAARQLKAGFIPLRKPGKLPYKTVRKSYSLEYGSDAIEIHADAIAPGDKVLLVDDLLATGGTMAAACDLVKELGGQIVGIVFLIELVDLKGRAKLAGQNIHSLLCLAGG